MFTGLVEEVGLLQGIERQGSSARLHIACSVVREGLQLGDSVAVDGACLTVTELDPSGFTVDVVPETLERTNLRYRQVGARVNLERSLRLGDRLGGHLVLGHVDGLARVEAMYPESSGYRVRFRAPAELARFIAEKGSVALNGVSLTVASVQRVDFEVSLIPFTLKNTNLGEIRPGDEVNLEVDVLARYVERIVPFRNEDSVSGLTEKRLRELGFE